MAILVDPIALEEIIKGLPLDDTQKKWISGRWLVELVRWDGVADYAKRWYFFLRSLVVVGGAAIPALVGLLGMAAMSAWYLVFSILSIFVSVAVAVSAGIEGLFAFGNIWREKRAAAELIKSEGFRFFALSGEYVKLNHAQAFPIFVSNVENLIRGEIKDYVIAAAPQTPDDGPRTPDDAARDDPINKRGK